MFDIIKTANLMKWASPELTALEIQASELTTRAVWASSLGQDISHHVDELDALNSRVASELIHDAAWAFLGHAQSQMILFWAGERASPDLGEMLKFAGRWSLLNTNLTTADYLRKNFC